MKERRDICNSALNILGGVIPGLIALAALPRILAIHGDIFLGVYMLQIAFLYVISLTDLGVSRAMMLVTFDDHVNPGKMIGPPFAVARILIFKFSFWLCLVGVVVGTLFLIKSSHYDIPISNLVLLLAGVISVNNLPFRSVLEIEGRFILLNLIRTSSAVLIYVAPLLFENNTTYLFSKIALILISSRIISYLIYYSLTSHQVNTLSRERILELRRVVFKRAKWVGLTNLLSLGLTYIDRYVVAFVVSVGAVASYTLATELSTKVWLVCAAIMTAINPSISRNYFSRISDNRSIIQTGRYLVYISILFPSTLFILNSQMLIEFWLKDESDLRINYLVSILLVGISVNSLAQLNFILLQLAGRERAGAYLQIYGIITLVVLALIFGWIYGVVGVAYAFTLRLILDALIGSYILSQEKSVSKPVSILELLLVSICLTILVEI